jgi:hypothetical protein
MIAAKAKTLDSKSYGSGVGLAAMADVLETNNYSTQQQVADTVGLKRNRIAYAAVVLEHAPDLADQVIAGGSLDQAYGIARIVAATSTIRWRRSICGLGITRARSAYLSSRAWAACLCNWFHKQRRLVV